MHECILGEFVDIFKVNFVLILLEQLEIYKKKLKGKPYTNTSLY